MAFQKFMQPNKLWKITKTYIFGQKWPFHAKFRVSVIPDPVNAAHLEVYHRIIVLKFGVSSFHKRTLLNPKRQVVF